MHGTIRLLSAVALAAALAGCAQTGRSTNPLAWFRKPAAEAQAAAPFKPPKGEPAGKEATKVASADAATAPNKPPAPSAKAVDPTKTGTSGHDAETLALIDEELKHASPEERERLFAEWKSLDGAMVQQVIRIRKMVRDLESASPASQTATAALPGTANPWQGNGSSSAGSAEQVRILPLGSSPPPTPRGAPQEGQELPTIQPAGQTASLASVGVQATAAYGNGTPPAPVVPAIATAEPNSIGANGLPPSAAAETAAVSSPPPLSLGASSSDAWTGQVRQLVAAAENRAEIARIGFLERPANAPPDDESRRSYVESQVQLRLLYLMAGEPARAMQAIPGLEAADQEFWQQVLWGVSNYFDATALPNRSDRVTQTIEQLRTAVTRLQGEANLQLRNVAFCRKIASFGNFERFERDEFSPGDQVLVYAEVLNFKSVPRTADGMYNTQLKSTIEIYRAGEGQPAKRIEFDPTIDTCRSYRQDYFHTYDLKIPADVTLGPHVLKLTVEDLQSRKVATYSVNFTVR